MSALLSADIHWALNERDAYRRQFMPRFIKLIEKFKCGTAIILGDLTEQKDYHSGVLVNRIVSDFKDLSEVVDDIYIDQGNHDYRADPDNAFFRFLGELPKIKWIRTPTFVQSKDFGKAMFLPHTRNPEVDWPKEKLTGLDYIFCHQTFQDSSIGFGQLLDGISLDLLPSDARAISGDIHVPQVLGKGKVTYAGSPHLVDFGDDFEPRVLLIDPKGMKSIPWEGPQKRLVEVSHMKDLDKIKVNEGDILKVRFQIDNRDRADWPNIVTDVRKWGEKNGLAVNAVLPVGDPAKPSKRIASRARQSDEEVMREFSKATSVEGRTLDVGLDLMEASR